MDIDDGNNSNGGNGGSDALSKEQRAESGKTGGSQEASSEDSSEGRSSTDSGLYVRRERSIDVFGGTPIPDQRIDIEQNKSREGLTTVMNRRPV
jgi:hypothetical protein